jgi:hypothetical protein
MSFQPHWKQGKTGMFILPAHAVCMHCKEPLSKRHGLNQNREGPATVCGWFLFAVGPLCLWCTQRFWTDKEWWTRSGSSEYHSGNWDLTKL